MKERGIGDSPGGVEQIQLQAVDPDTAIHIAVPPPNSDDPETQQARKIFEAFPPGLQRALERGQLEDINVVLGKMAVDEAEEIVELLGQGGMLSIEPKIIDTTKGETIPEHLMPRQCPSRTPLLQARTERDVRTPLNNWRQENRQFRGPIAVVAIQEHNHVGGICRPETCEAGSPVASAWFLNDAGSHFCGDVGRAVR